MAIAFVAASTRLKADIGTSGSPQNVPLPAGHASGHLLLMTVVTDDNTGPLTPTGWTLLTSFSPGLATVSPYSGPPRTTIFYRIDNGSLGSSVSVAFSTSAWPTGSPYVIAFTVAYSGCDTTNPIGEWGTLTATLFGAAQNHPQLTTALANCWLLTIRGAGAQVARTFTNSVGTDAERVDDSHGTAEAPSVALYDSNAALAAGLQTQRTTTASGICHYGSSMVSIAIRPAPVATGVVALAGLASVTAVAYPATAAVVIGPWDLCNAADGLPDYRLAIDWDADASLDTYGVQRNPNPYFRTGITGYTAAGSTLAWARDPVYEMPAVLITPDGVSVSGGANQSPITAVGTVVPGNTYDTEVWVYSPGGWSDFQPAVDWFDASGAFLSSGVGTGEAVPAGVWTLIRRTYTAPASASRVSVRARHGSTPPASAVWYAWGLLFIDRSVTTPLMTMGPGEDVTSQEIDDVVVSYGRDQDRQLSPGAVGTASLRLCNADRFYSPENASSPLFGDLDPARDARFQVTWAGQTFPIFRGKIDDYSLSSEFSDRTASFTFLDGMTLLQSIKLSTEVFSSLRTGELIDVVLDYAGWTAPRNIDYGATVVKYWWAEGTDALTAIQELVRSEGPPSVAYVGPDGSFNFHDRHHRLQDQASRDVQGSFVTAAIGCDAPAASGLSVGQPFVYEHGWRDIVNSVTFEISERVADIGWSEVWSSEDSFSLTTGQSLDLDVTTNDPFVDALTPVAGTDYTTTGAGTLSVTLSKTSGQAVKITLLAVGGAVDVLSFRLRARPIPVLRTFKVTRIDSNSIEQHGQRDYPDPAPWANANDAAAIADMILLHYAERRPTVQIRVHTQNPTHFLQVLQRTISDRVRIRNDELGLDDDFYVERVTHTIQRINRAGTPPVHSVVLGCEKQLTYTANPFTFDKRGAGFDDGIFDPIQVDDPATVFTFDHPTQGQFDVGLFGT